MATSDSTSDSTEKKRYIYFLIDPRNEKVFYVGQTTNHNGRHKAHVRCATVEGFYNSEHQQYIQGILDAGLIPIMHVREEVWGKRDADIRERAWIVYWRNRGNVLTNMLIISIQGVGQWEHPADNYESIKRNRLDIRKEALSSPLRERKPAPAKKKRKGKLNPGVVKAIKSLSSKMTVMELSKRYSMHYKVIEGILTGKITAE